MLPIHDSKDLLMQGFKSIDTLIEESEAKEILKDISFYVLSPVISSIGKGQSIYQKRQSIFKDDCTVAFKKADKEVQDYLLSDQLEDDIERITKSLKITNKEQIEIIIKTIYCVIIGVLDFSEAERFMIEDFEKIKMPIKSFKIAQILQDIDTEILQCFAIRYINDEGEYDGYRQN